MIKERPAKLLITGSNGLLGSNLAAFFSARENYELYCTSLHSSSSSGNFIPGNLLDRDFLERLMDTVKPRVIINTVGSVNLDRCDEDPEYARKITVETAINVSTFARSQGIRLIYISTDHLFDGKGSMYSEEDIPAPVNVYGKMKLKAEREVLQILPEAIIARTNFFGWSPPSHPTTFAEWVYESLEKQIPITLFTDYYFTPIEITYLAEALEIVVRSDFSGIINIAGSERCSKYDFGLALAEIFQLDTKVIRAGSIEAFPFKARRQKNLSLSTEKYKKIFKKHLPNLREGLVRFYHNRKYERV